MENTTVLDDTFARPEFVPQLASSGTRFLNLVIDRIILYVLMFIIAFAIGYSGNPEVFESDLNAYLMYFGIMLLYYIILESNGGQTVGKMITRCKVVNVAGEKPGVGSIVKRTFSRLIPLEGLSFLGNKVGIHDSLSKTLVITNYRVNTM